MLLCTNKQNTNFPINTNVRPEFWGRGATYDYPYYWIDEVWVVAK